MGERVSDYTPTTEEVREQYWAASGDPRRGSEAWEEFDRWFASEIEKAERRGADYLFQTLAERGIITLTGDE